MPDPIALWTVDRLKPLALQLTQSGLHALLRSGNVVEARVIAMLATDVAELEILGKTIEVSTPKALKAGTTISVAINRSGRGLELVIQPDASAARLAAALQPAGVPGRGPGWTGEIASSALPPATSIEDWVLAAQAAIKEAVLGSESIVQNSGLASALFQPVIQASYPAAGFPSQVQLQAEIRARYELDAEPSAPDPGEVQNLGSPASAYEASRLTAQPAVFSLVVRSARLQFRSRDRGAVSTPANGAPDSATRRARR